MSLQDQTSGVLFASALTGSSVKPASHLEVDKPFVNPDRTARQELNPKRSRKPYTVHPKKYRLYTSPVSMTKLESLKAK